MDKKHGNTPDNNKHAKMPGSRNEKSHIDDKASKELNSGSLADSPSILTCLSWAIAVTGMSSAPRSFWLPKLQTALKAITSYAHQKHLTINTLKNFDAVNGTPSSALYADFKTINESFSENDSAWDIAFSTYASLIPIWMALGKSDSVTYTLNNMNQQLSFLDPGDQVTAKGYIQTVKANLTGTPNKDALKKAVTKIQEEFGPPLDILSSSDAQKAA